MTTALKEFPWEVLRALADAADDVGVKFFDTDTMDPLVEKMQAATQAARAALSASPAPVGEEVLEDARKILRDTDFDADNPAYAGPRKDAAYLERNQVVAALASLFPSGTARTAIPGWSDDWHGCVYIDLPTGQASWHYHDSHAHLFAHLPPYRGQWDGHTTAEKYARVAALSASPASPAPVGGEALEMARELVELARKATPGPWKSTPTDPAEGGEWFWITACPLPNQEREIATVSGPQNKRNTANARFIAAARNHIDAIATALLRAAGEEVEDG